MKDALNCLLVGSHFQILKFSNFQITPELIRPKLGYRLIAKTQPMKSTYTIKGMTCSGCATTVKKLLSSVEGVKEAEVSLSENKAVVTQEHNVNLEVLKIALRGFPYEIVERE